MLLAATVVLPAIMVICPPAIQGATLYQLDEASSYQEGCFAPCMCPIMMTQTLRGTLLLVPAGSDGETRLFNIADIDWHFDSLGQDIAVTGSGVYTVSMRQQRLELDLQAGDEVVRHYDSGLVPVVAQPPAISIAIAANGFFCYDHAFDIAARPSIVEARGDTWGSIKAIYR